MFHNSNKANQETPYLLKMQVLVQYEKPVLGIGIRMFLGLMDPDPDPSVRGTDPGPSVIKQT